MLIENEPDFNQAEMHDREVLDREVEVVRSRGSAWDMAAGRLRAFGFWIGAALAVLETALAFRLGFLAGGANPSNGFVDFVYDLSGPFVGPFEGIFSNRAVDGGVFEPAALIAMIVYLAAALLLVGALWALTAGPSPTGERSVVSRSRRQTSAVREDQG
jgi:hypothetical protein